MELKKQINEYFLEQLIEEILTIKDIQNAKDALFSFKKPSEKLKKGVEICIKFHEGQFRKSGEPYAVHPILVGILVAFMGGDDDMIIAALLHDVIEDTDCDFESIVSEFGEEIGKLVQGLTKIISIRVNSDKEEDIKLSTSALTFRKMLMTSIEDVRVLVIKLCDRLHNMLTLESLREEKRKRISEETLMVYAPIAHRLGISSIKNLLEDLSFKYVLPEEYNKIEEYINEHKQQLQLKLNTFSVKVNELLLINGFCENSFELEKRIKHHYSIYLKMQRKGISIEEVLDLLAIRIIVQNPIDCYKVLGILHINFNPLIARLKDYVALPKQNGYQTIHTTIFDTKNIIEAQIRTFDMHKTAEYGVAAHWKYKSGDLRNPNLNWLNDLSEQEQKDENAEELYEYAKDSLYVEDIAIYSPKGEIFTLPRGATALDYAYEIHSEIGLRAKEAFVNRIRVPLLTELKNGDIVRIVTSDEPQYRCSWLESVKTGKAKATIKFFCKQKIKEINNQIALKILSAIFATKEMKILEWLENEGLTKKVYRIAYDSVFLKEIVNLLKKYTRKDKLFNINLKDKYDIKKQKFDNIVVYSNYKINEVLFDYCCNPKRGDDILGFRDNHSVNVHHKLCDRALKLMLSGEEMIYVKWTRNAPHRYGLILNLENKRGSLATLLSDLVKLQVDLVTINLKENFDSVVDFFYLVIELNENLDLETIKERLKSKYKIIEFKSLDDVYSS